MIAEVKNMLWFFFYYPFNVGSIQGWADGSLLWKGAKNIFMRFVCDSYCLKYQKRNYDELLTGKSGGLRTVWKYKERDWNFFFLIHGLQCLKESVRHTSKAYAGIYCVLRWLDYEKNPSKILLTKRSTSSTSS